MGTGFQAYVSAVARLASVGLTAPRAAAAQTESEYPTPTEVQDGTTFELWYWYDQGFFSLQAEYVGSDAIDFGTALYLQGERLKMYLTDIYSSQQSFTHGIPWVIEGNAWFQWLSSETQSTGALQIPDDLIPAEWWSKNYGVVFFRWTRISTDGTTEETLFEGWIDLILVGNE